MLWIATLTLVVLWTCGFAQTDWQEPENLGQTINSEFSDWYPVLARDGSFLIFVSTRPGGEGQGDLWISYSQAGVWQTPQNLGPNVNTAGFESAPFLAAGDSVLYYASFAAGGSGAMDIYWCELSDGVPGPRYNMGSPINGPALDCCPVLSKDGNSLYICSDRGPGYGQMDVWVSERTPVGWSQPVNMGGMVNSSNTDCPRWISDDGNTLLIASTRSDGHGDADLWYTERSDDIWGEPINLGDTINTSAAEWGAWFSENEGEIAGTMYFGSGRSGGIGQWDVWYSEAGAAGVGETLPHSAMRLDAYPNPGNSQTTLSYALAEAARVIIKVYDLEGHLIRSLLDQAQTPGDHRTTWDTTLDTGEEAPGGVYCCKVLAGESCVSKTIVLAK